jgi:hypothetical protein
VGRRRAFFSYPLEKSARFSQLKTVREISTMDHDYANKCLKMNQIQILRPAESYLASHLL